MLAVYFDGGRYAMDRLGRDRAAPHFLQHDRRPLKRPRLGRRIRDDAPDLPGCVATGATVQETEQLPGEAIEWHVDGLREDGLPVPEPSSDVDYVEVPD